MSHPQTAIAPEIPYLSEFVIIQGNSVKAIISPQTPNFAIYGALVGKDDVIYLLEQLREEYPELYRIIKCESNFRPNVCSYKGCYAGMGLAQIIPSTWKLVQKNGLKVGDPFNAEDNLTAAIWLYETYGNKPWLQSQKCWDK